MEKRNISVSSVNGYTLENVLKAKQYLKEIGSNQRRFDFARLVTMYNDLKGTNESTSGCKCQSAKYYNGIQNHFKFGKMTLIANGVATEEDFADEKKVEEPIENEENRIVLGDVDEEEAKKEAMRERMAKVRAQRGKKKEEEDVENRD